MILNKTVASDFSPPLNVSLGVSAKDFLKSTSSIYFDPPAPPGDQGGIVSSLFNQAVIFIQINPALFFNFKGWDFTSFFAQLSQWFSPNSKFDPISFSAFKVNEQVKCSYPIIRLPESYVVCPLRYVKPKRAINQQILEEKISEVEEKLHVVFKDKKLIIKALCHSSYSNEAASDGSNERLEFLGDSVLGLIISEILFDKLQDCDEGELTNVRSLLVNTHACSIYFSNLNLSEFLLLGVGKQGELENEIGLKSIYANFFEAVLAAVYKDQGLKAAKKFCIRHCAPHFEEILISRDTTRNWKGELQEFSMKTFKEFPKYTLVESSGADHDPTFISEVEIPRVIKVQGVGKTKKESEQNAASIAYEKLTA